MHIERLTRSHINIDPLIAVGAATGAEQPLLRVIDLDIDVPTILHVERFGGESSSVPSRDLKPRISAADRDVVDAPLIDGAPIHGCEVLTRRRRAELHVNGILANRCASPG